MKFKFEDAFMFEAAPKASSYLSLAVILW